MQIAARQHMWAEDAKDGTALMLEAGPEGMTALISRGLLAEGSEAVTVSWGDGTTERLPGISDATHTYAAAGAYRVRISDDLRSFGYTSYSGTPGQREMLLKVLSVGSRVERIEEYAFNGCSKLRGDITLPGVSYIGGYAFGLRGSVDRLYLPSMRHLDGNAFYCNGGVLELYADNAETVSPQFFVYAGIVITDLYLRSRTREAVKSMRGFPFCAAGAVRFHGSDGVVLGNGTFV